ncbi:MAG: replicative DNA helicase [Nitriliruptorales bacterium]
MATDQRPKKTGASSPASPNGSPSYDRTPPQHLEAEVAVLGAALLSRSALAEVMEILRAEDFYRSTHRLVYEAVMELFRRGEAVDPITVVDQLSRSGRLDDAGGASALHDLVASVPTAANAIYYARIVKEKAMLRRLIDAGTEVVGLGYDGGEDVNLVIDRAEQLVYDVAQGRVGTEYTELKELLSEGFERIEQRYENRSEVTGLATGFNDLDRLTAGLQKQNLIVVAARPAMGKSSFALSIAEYVTVQLRQPAVIFSLEMSRAEIVDRILSSEARVDSQKIRTGRLAEADWAALSDAMGRLAEAPLFVDDTAAVTMMEIRSKCRRLKQRHGLDLVIVDYLQLMQSHRRVENRVQEVSEISRSLKMLAKELDVPVIALSQLSRQPEARTDKRPQLADLRESGCLTADTRVLRADTGASVTLGELYASGERDIPVWALDEHLRLVPGLMSHVFSSGVKPVYKMTLRSGRQIRASANHPFRTFDGWTPLERLAPGDRLAVPRRIADPVVPTGDTIPREVWNRVRELRGASPFTEREFQDAIGTKYCGTTLYKSNVSRARLGRVVAVLPDQRLEDLVLSDVMWDEIASIEPDGMEEVFDATVPGNHNFVAGGIVVHNSIEQDADVVGFIYRDEVYDPDTPDRGIAELHIAKQRNGPTSTVKLAFLDHLTKFANLARTSV